MLYYNMGMATQMMDISFHDYCEQHGLRVTEPRVNVFNILKKAKKPLTAYEILDKVAEKKATPKPPTIYRAIEFLIEQHLVHRIESLNAYILCQSNHKHEGSQFMICTSCGKVDESHLCHMPQEIVKKSEKIGFAPSRWNFEIYGECQSCQA